MAVFVINSVWFSFFAFQTGKISLRFFAISSIQEKWFMGDSYGEEDKRI